MLCPPCLRDPLALLQIAFLFGENAAAIFLNIHAKRARPFLSGAEIRAEIAVEERDAVAYVRFASVYREFKDVETFLQELQSLTDAPSAQAGDVNPDKTEK